MGTESPATNATLLVFKALKEAAREMRLVTYNELAAAGGAAPQGVGKQLAVIHDKLSRLSPEFPWLVAIAVSERKRTPGTGLFAGEDFRLDFDNPGHRAWWRAMLAAVFAADWSRIEIE